MVRETQQTIITDPETSTEKAFTFDYSYNSFADADDPEHASQDTVWNDIGVKVRPCLGTSESSTSARSARTQS